MQALISHDTERARLQAEVARLTTELEHERSERIRFEQLADCLGKEKAKLEKKLAVLEHEHELLRQRQFGRSSERLREEAEEAGKEAEATSPTGTGATGSETPKLPPEDLQPKPKKGHGRRARPKIPRREKVEHIPTPDELVCTCGGQMRSISSDEVTGRYDYRPASLVLVERVRPRFRCPKCLGRTIMAPLPPAPIERGLAESGLLAYVAASKFSDHLPLNRIKAILAREGVDFPCSTLCRWIDQTAGLVEAIADEVRKQALKHVVVGMDETGIRIIFEEKDEETGSHARRGKIWAYRGRPGEVFFVISETKTHDDKNGPQTVLKLRHGFVQADADGTFDILFKDGSRIEVGCNAHARRKFVQAQKSHPKEVAFVLSVYRRVYKIEARLREATPEVRKATRQAETKPLLDSLDAYLDQLAPTLVPGTPMAIAVNYSRKHRVALRRFLEHGELEADNNAVERALRLVAVGRRNWLFAGSPNAARNAAIFYTLVGSCKDLGIDPWEYLRDMIERVTTHPDKRIAELTPRAWLEARRRARQPGE